jgi:signal transduction histidine kinase
VLLLAGVYFIAGTIGLQFAIYRDGVSLVWGPSGISLAALLLFGQRLWPGVFLGALLVNLGTPSASVASALVIAVGNTLEAVVGVALLIHVADFRPSLERVRDGAAFFLIGALGCTMISATIGTSAFSLFGFAEASELPMLWTNWWLGDLGGVLIMTPLLLMLVHGTPSWRFLARKAETWVALACAAATTSFAFFGPDLGLLGFAASISPIPVLVWVGIRLGPRGATIASFIMILIATAATSSDTGPFVVGSQTEAMVLLWSWSIFMAVTAFTLAAAVEQRNFVDRRRRLEEADRLGIEKEKLLLLERERLTREMHDGLGGQLVSVLAMVERGLAPRSEVSESLRRALDDIRIVIDSLDPSTADLPVSLGKLRARLEPLLRRNSIALAWNVEFNLHPDTLAPEEVLHVLRIIQETVTNTLRHADARNVEMTITLDDEQERGLHLSVSDDGRGLPTDRTIAGRGIVNMKARAREMGARIRIENTGMGTVVDLVIPDSRSTR